MKEPLEAYVLNHSCLMGNYDPLGHYATKELALKALKDRLKDLRSQGDLADQEDFSMYTDKVNLKVYDSPDGGYSAIHAYMYQCGGDEPDWSVGVDFYSVEKIFILTQ